MAELMSYNALQLFPVQALQGAFRYRDNGIAGGETSRKGVNTAFFQNIDLRNRRTRGVITSYSIHYTKLYDAILFIFSGILLATYKVRRAKT